MPLVVVSPGHTRNADTVLAKLTPELPRIVAAGLTCEDKGGQLYADDVGVQVRRPDKFDVNESHLSIVIFANDFPARRVNIEERKELIAGKIRKVIPGVEGSVWIRLAPAAYGVL